MAKHCTSLSIKLVGLIVASLQASGLWAQFGATQQYFAQAARGPGAKTFVALHNPTSSPIVIDLEMPAPGGTAVFTQSIPLDPSQSTSLELPATGSLEAGWIRLTSNGRFTATEIFELTVRQLNRIGVLPSQPTRQLKFFATVGNGRNAGLAVANLSETEAAEVTVRLVRTDGQVAKERTFQLEALQHLARFLDEDPYFTGMTSFEGMVEISSSQLIAAVALLSQGYELTTVAVETLALPIRGEYPPVDDPNTWGPNLIGGHRANSVDEGVVGATISGGGSQAGSHTVTGDHGAVGGGFGNAAAVFSTVGGGYSNIAGSQSSTVGGGFANEATGQFSTVSGGRLNVAAGVESAISGGDRNTATGGHAVIGGGTNNAASASYSTISGGYNHTAEGAVSAIGGGVSNGTSGAYSVIGGGALNQTGSQYSCVGGGSENIAGGDFATVGGGQLNLATGPWSTIPGGIDNLASAAYSLAAGRRAHARHPGAFVWGDSTDADVSSGVQNQFTVRATGGTRFYSGTSPNTGVRLPPGSGSWSSFSDRSSKENFDAVEKREVLEKLATLPVSTWNYEAQGPTTRHMGPVAQDFFAAFGLGSDDRQISSVDADGVALAAIQGLYAILNEQQVEIEALKIRLEALEEQPE